MGAWAAGLYSSDMAADMRATVKSVLRLPLDEDRIVDILRDSETQAANDADNEDHTTFWLVLADQFEKRGIAHAATREKAINIIDRGDDLMMMEKLGMKLADLRKRSAKLAELRARLTVAPRVSKPRATIKAPESYVLEVGVLYACPVKGSNCINPYFSKKDFERFPWTPDGWRQFVVLDRGRAFDYLAWYQPLVCKKPVQQKPRIVEAGADLVRAQRAADGTPDGGGPSTACELKRSAHCRSPWTRREHDSRRGGQGSCSSAGVAVAQRSMTSQLPTR